MQKLLRHGSRATAALAALSLALFLPPCAARAQQKEVPASVSGRVREGERGIAGVAVVVMASDPQQRFKPVARARTDAEGRYRIGGVQPGRYTIMTVAPTYVVADANNFPPGSKPLTLSAGDSVEDVDFRVVRGGVITGRVTDSDGNPVIGEAVNLTPADRKQGIQTNPTFNVDRRDVSTDDRGVYRIYGIQPGRYFVSVGNDGRSFRAPGAKYYRRTFYPSVAEESQAKVVEVRAGEESTDVDITLGAPEKTYKVSGKFVLADTSQPVHVSAYGYGMLEPKSGRLMGDYAAGSSNARGEFQATGLAPGRYRIFTYPGSREEAGLYSEAPEFEITDSDVSGVVVKLRRGATLTGVVSIEGTSDRALIARLLPAVQVYGMQDRRNSDDGVPGFIPPSPVAADGSFRLTGIRPGRVRLHAEGNAKGLMFSRVELGGVERREGVEVTEGAQVSGVRLVLLYGNAVLRGQVNFPGGGNAPQGVRTMVVVRRAGAPEGQGARNTEADTRGRFQIEGLAAGEYEVQARSFSTGGAGVAPLLSESQRVSVTEGGEMTVTLTLAPTQPRGGRP